MKLKRILQRASVLLMFSMVGLFAYAQKSFTCTVVDEFGDPMIGVSALVKGTTSGEISDLDGVIRFQNLKPSDVLVISYVGFASQEVKVGDRSAIKVVLKEDSEALDEVVVVGYGTMKKSDLTGSVASIGTDKLVAKGAPSVMENLQGSVAGVSITQSSGRINDDFNIEIRGKSSHNSGLQPLYVVDGVICDDIAFLNQQDIERIDILKDASSTAIYGSRATAGVVMVTTKSGALVGEKVKEARSNISYDGYYGVTNTARMPDFMDGQEFYNYRFLKFLSYAEGGAATAQSGRPAYQMGAYSQMALLNSITGNHRLKELLAADETYDWPSLVTQSGRQQNHYLAVSGNSEKMKYHMGLGFEDNVGIYKGDSQTKVNFKGSVEANINKYVTGGFSFNLAKMDRSYANDVAVQNAYRMNPFMQPYDADGNINRKPGNYEAMGSDNGYQFSDQPSPFLYIDNQTRLRERWRMLGNAYIQIKPVKGLNIKSTFSPNFSYTRLGQFDGVMEEDDDFTTNKAQKTDSRAFDWTWDNIVNYNTTIAEKHAIDLMGLASLTASNSEKDYLLYSGVLDGTDWWNMASGTYNAEESENSYSEKSMLSYALRANYSYASKYMLTGTIRWDGSSKFADGYRWGSFPSIAAAWRLSEESWMKREWLSNLKLRVSYGMTGNNTPIGNFATQQTVGGPIYYPFGSVYAPGFYPSGVVDTELSWEASKEVNLGLDFGFFNNRITGNIELYNKNSYDLLYDVQLPLEAGTTSEGKLKSMSTNVGKVNNKGLEIQMTTVNVANKNWYWETGFSFSRNINTLLEINGLGEDLPSDGLFINQPINNVYQYHWTGIVSDRDMVVPDNEIAKLKGLTPGTTMKEYEYYYTCYGWTEGQVIIDDVDGNGSIDDNDKKVFSADPKWVASFNTSLSYKSWDFSASLYAKVGYHVNSSFYQEYTNFSDRGRSKLNVDYYIPAGTLIDCDGVNADGTYINPVYQATTHYGNYPFPNNGGANAGVGDSHWTGAANRLANISYLKVKNMTLGYTLPKNALKKIGAERVRLYLTVTNPFVFTNYRGFDPEWAGASGKYDGPSTISWQLGANLKF